MKSIHFTIQSISLNKIFWKLAKIASTSLTPLFKKNKRSCVFHKFPENSRNLILFWVSLDWPKKVNIHCFSYSLGKLQFQRTIPGRVKLRPACLLLLVPLRVISVFLCGILFVCLGSLALALIKSGRKPRSRVQRKLWLTKTTRTNRGHPSEIVWTG